MNIKNIKVGQRLRIVGDKRGCNEQKCNNCKYFPEKLIEVVEESNIYDLIPGINPYDKDIKCFFEAEDLEPLSWKERYGGGK